MKTRFFRGILLLFFCTFCFTGCDNADGVEREVTDYKEYVLTIASKKVPGVLFSDGRNYLTDVYAAKKESANDWTGFGYIDEFDFEEGYEYAIKISETNYLDYAMGTPSWTEYKLLEVISKQQKSSKDLPSHFIPKWYYENQFIPEYRYAIEADDKESIEEELKTNAILPLNSHYLIYGADKWIIIDDANEILGKGILKRANKSYEKFPETYQILKPEGNVLGYMEWTFLDESGDEAIYPPFDVFFTGGGGSKARMDYTPKITPHLYYDLTAYYKSQYPEAGVKAVVVSFTIKF